MEFLRLLYTTSGEVGRKTWWLTQLISIVLLAILFALLFHTVQHAAGIPGPHTILGYMRSFNLLANSSYDLSNISSTDTTILCVLAVCILLIVWVHFTVEIKRWHDLSLPGYCVLLRFVPGVLRHFLPTSFASCLSVLLLLAVVYLLGFRAGDIGNGR
jgi:uncharacterized membrane protein YhaH (DUF805 family)